MTTAPSPLRSGRLDVGQLAFRASGVSKSYPGVLALDGLDLDGYAGEVLAICGANGAGKSTFARLLAGQEQPTYRNNQCHRLGGTGERSRNRRASRDPSDAPGTYRS